VYLLNSLALGVGFGHVTLGTDLSNSSHGQSPLATMRFKLGLCDVKPSSSEHKHVVFILISITKTLPANTFLGIHAGLYIQFKNTDPVYNPISGMTPKSRTGICSSGKTPFFVWTTEIFGAKRTYSNPTLFHLLPQMLSGTMKPALRPVRSA
jgi:hypothetical protein